MDPEKKPKKRGIVVPTDLIIRKSVKIYTKSNHSDKILNQSLT